MQKRQIVRCVKKWLKLSDFGKEDHCPFSSYDTRYGTRFDQDKFSEEYCKGICHKHFKKLPYPKGAPYAWCPCNYYIMKDVIKGARRIIKAYEKV